MKNTKWLGSLIPLVIALVIACHATSAAEKPANDAKFTPQYWTDARVYSYLPDQELATYRSYSGGGVGPRGTLGLGVGNKERRFHVTIEARLKASRFLAKVTVKPEEGDDQKDVKEPTPQQDTEYDLSDLNPRMLEIARDADGRIYRLTLLPRIIEEPQPRQFNAADLRLEYFSFPSSPVILNDQDYIGTFSFSSGPLVWCDIPGVAKIEFSLLHLKDASPIGTLENGVVKISHENGTMLRVSDVKNGVNRETLGGGPYRVWVRWGKPSQTPEEHRASIKEHLASLKERVKSGDLALPPSTLKRLEKMNETDRIGLIDSGVTGVEQEDLVKE